MKSLKKTAATLILASAVLFQLGAQTVLVHSPSYEENEEKALIYQAAESGIMDVLFEKGFITFSDSSEADDAALEKLAARTGSDYILRWEVADFGIEGSFMSVSDGLKGEIVRITREDLGRNIRRQDELYAVLGNRLCENLVKGQW